MLSPRTAQARHGGASRLQGRRSRKDSESLEAGSRKSPVGANLASARSARSRIEAIRERFAAHGQEHVFRHWDELDPAGRERLADQAAHLDLGRLEKALERARALGAGAADLEPLPVERLPEHGGSRAAIAVATERGGEMLAAGRVAAFVVAGGQGTRLGFAGPKGALPIGPVSQRSLFELQAQKLRGLRRRWGRPVPWYIMTSDATDGETRQLLQEREYFGLSPQDVIAFRQQTIPAFDFEGRLVLERPDRIFENPNGHGGSLTALVSSKSLDDMEDRGVDTIFYYQVDNPLVRMCDPAFLGFHDAAGAEMSCKVVRKREPEEKVGVLARADGRARVVEYTEIEPADRDAREPSGELRFWAGNIAIHALSTSFVRRVDADADRLLPYHASAKAIAHLDENGRAVHPSQPNGFKLERFVFDALPAASRTCAVEARREDEFSPVKDAEGANSPAGARAALVRLYRSWLEAVGVELPGDVDSVELDHSLVDGPEDLRDAAWRSVADLGDAIQIATGTATGVES